MPKYTYQNAPQTFYNLNIFRETMSPDPPSLFGLHIGMTLATPLAVTCPCIICDLWVILC